MLYFEDFMEAIENLPSEWKDSLTTMRQLDLQAQNTIETLDCQTESFFQKCKLSSMTTTAQENEYKRLLDEFEKAQSYAKDKKDIAQHIYDTYEKCMRRLETELAKFKLELEADNAGITEGIERNVLASETTSHPAIQRGDRKRSRYLRGGSARLGGNKGRFGGHNTVSSRFDSSSLDMLGGSNFMNPVMTSVLGSASGGGMGHVADSPNSLGEGATPPTPASRRAFKWPISGGEPIRKKSKISTDDSFVDDDPGAVDVGIFEPGTCDPGSASSVDGHQSIASLTNLPSGGGSSSNQYVTTPGVWEPGHEDTERYCLCNDVSHGEMVACDNGNCTVEWFHYGCVGLTVAPKGSWFCPICKDARRKARR